MAGVPGAGRARRVGRGGIHAGGQGRSTGIRTWHAGAGRARARSEGQGGRGGEGAGGVDTLGWLLLHSRHVGRSPATAAGDQVLPDTWEPRLRSGRSEVVPAKGFGAAGRGTCHPDRPSSGVLHQKRPARSRLFGDDSLHLKSTLRLASDHHVARVGLIQRAADPREQLREQGGSLPGSSPLPTARRPPTGAAGRRSRPCRCRAARARCAFRRGRRAGCGRGCG